MCSITSIFYLYVERASLSRTTEETLSFLPLSRVYVQKTFPASYRHLMRLQTYCGWKSSTLAKPLSKVKVYRFKCIINAILLYFGLLDYLILIYIFFFPLDPVSRVFEINKYYLAVLRLYYIIAPHWLPLWLWLQYRDTCFYSLLWLQEAALLLTLVFFSLLVAKYVLFSMLRAGWKFQTMQSL